MSDWLLIPLFGASIFIVVYNWSDNVISWLHRKSLGQRDYVTQKLDLMFVEVDQKKITTAMLLLSFGTGSLFFILLWPSLLAGFFMFAIMTAVGWTLPKYSRPLEAPPPPLAPPAKWEENVKLGALLVLALGGIYLIISLFFPRGSA